MEQVLVVVAEEAEVLDHLTELAQLDLRVNQELAVETVVQVVLVTPENLY